MKVAVWYGDKNIVLEDRPIPGIGEKDVLVRVKSSSICGADLHAYKGLSKRRKPPLVMGHEFSGMVERLGDETKSLKVGDRVVVEPIISCGKCKACKKGKTNVCENRKLIGLNLDGAFAEYVSVPYEKCHELPKNLSFDEGAIIEPLAVAVHAVNITPISSNDNALIIGSGVIGLLITQLLRSRTSGDILVTGRRDYLLEKAREFGATDAINVMDCDAVKTLLKKHGRVDVVFEAVGSNETVNQSISLVESGGSITLVGMLDREMTVDMMEVVAREITLRGDYGYTTDDFKEAIELASSGKVDLKSLITHVLPLDEIKKGFDILAERRENVIKVVINP